MTALVHSYADDSLGFAPSKTFGITATAAGSSIVIELAIRSKSTTYTDFNVSDNQGNEYVSRVVGTNTATQRTAAIIDCIGATAGVTAITVTPVGGGGEILGCVAIQEVSGITAPDQSGSAEYASSPLIVTTGTPDAASTDFVAAAIACGSNSTAQGISDPPAGWTSAAANQNDNGSTSGSGECCYRINSNVLTDSASWAITAGGTAGDPAVIASYTSVTPVNLAGAANDTTVASGMLAATLQGAALDTNSALGTLTNWADVTLAAPLYTGVGGVLDPNFWTGGNVPVAGDTLYYDPTYITIKPNAEIISTSNNCSAIVQFNDGTGNAVGLIVIVPGAVAYASDTTSATGNLTSYINLAAAASDAVTAVGTLTGNNLLQGAAADVITATGALFEAISLASAAADTTSASATLGTQNQLNGAANDVVTALATLTTAALFQGSAVDVTSAAATLAGPPFVTSALNPINIGSTPGDGTGDAARAGFLKIRADLATLLSAVANRPTVPGTFGVTSALGTALMLIDTSQTWEINQFAGQTVTITSGTLPAIGAPTVPTSNVGYSRIVASNTANALSWASALPFAVGPNVGYQVSAAQINAGSSGFATVVGETTPSTIIDANQSWSADQWAGSQVTMMGGPYAGQTSLIASNTDIGLTLATAFSTPIPAGTPYVIGQRPVGTSGVTATLAATQNDYAAPGWVAGMKRQILAPPSGGATITGFSAFGVEDGDEFMLRNPSATDPILLPHLSGLSQTVNMISCPGGLEYELPPLTNVRLSYVENVWTIYA